MKKYDIEMIYSIGFSLGGIEAESEKDAVRKARKLLEKETVVITNDVSVDNRGLEFNQVTYIQEG